MFHKVGWLVREWDDVNVSGLEFDLLNACDQGWDVSSVE